MTPTRKTPRDCYYCGSTKLGSDDWDWVGEERRPRCSAQDCLLMIDKDRIALGQDCIYAWETMRRWDREAGLTP